MKGQFVNLAVATGAERPEVVGRGLASSGNGSDVVYLEVFSRPAANTAAVPLKHLLADEWSPRLAPGAR
jgi:hypothetical protein